MLVTVTGVARSQASQETTSLTIDGIEIKVGGVEDSEKVVAWKYLHAKKGVDTPEDLKTAAAKDLKKKNLIPIDYYRVEVNGVATHDVTSDKIPGMFDKQLRMSYMNSPAVSGEINQTVHDGFRWLRDLGSAVHDMNGEPTMHAKDVLWDLQRKNISELIAHSWATEAIYAAIISGYILPPKKLILVGIPEENEEQWRMLARYTGIEVHVVGFSTDKVQVSGNTVNYFATGLPRDPKKLEKLWHDRCAKRNEVGCSDPREFDSRKFDYNVNVKVPTERKALIDRLHLTVDSDPLSHDRILYYEYLAEHGLFNKTIAQLDGPQQKRIKEQVDLLLAEANREAHDLLQEARNLLANENTAVPSKETMRDQQGLAGDDRIGSPLAENFTNEDIKTLKHLVARESPIPVAVALAVPSDYRRRWRKYLEKNIAVMKYYAKLACSPRDDLTAEDMYAFRKAYYVLEGNLHPSDHQIAGYSPETASNGLSDCDLEVMTEFLRYPDNDLNNNSRSILLKYFPPEVQSSIQPNHNPIPESNPRPRPNPIDYSCSYVGGIRVCP
jgi:hypothetical protein